MDNQPLDPSIEEKARALCAQITVAHDLDSEIQEELYGHVEDKILGYLRGEISVSGDDALILVREHFGDAATSKSLVQDVHVTEVAVSQWRRYAAAAIAMLGCTLVGEVALNAVFVFTHLFQANLMWAVWIVFAVLVVATLAPWAIFVRWQRTLRAGRRPWYYRWHFTTLGVTILGLAFVKVLIPSIGISVDANSNSLPASFFGTDFLKWMMFSGRLVLIFLQCLSWLWWCDASPRTGRSTLNAAWAWCFSFAFVSTLPRMFLSLSKATDGSMSANWAGPGFGFSMPLLGRFGMLDLIIIAMVAAFVYALSTGAVKRLRDGLAI